MHRRRRLQLSANFGVISPLKKKRRLACNTIRIYYYISQNFTNFSAGPSLLRSTWLTPAGPPPLVRKLKPAAPADAGFVYMYYFILFHKKSAHTRAALQRPALAWPTNPELAQVRSSRISGSDSQTARENLADGCSVANTVSGLPMR
jgi:hypothetical protein